jgi:hypothetical protein
MLVGRFFAYKLFDDEQVELAVGSPILILKVVRLPGRRRTAHDVKTRTWNASRLSDSTPRPGS